MEPPNHEEREPDYKESKGARPNVSVLMPKRRKTKSWRERAQVMKAVSNRNRSMELPNHEEREQDEDELVERARASSEKQYPIKTDRWKLRITRKRKPDYRESKVPEHK